MSYSRSSVKLIGKVLSINETKRDILLKVGDEEIVCHLWTTINDSRGAWRSSDEWREYVIVDETIIVNGYLGNNNRVVVAPGGIELWYRTDPIPSENSVQAICTKAEDDIIQTATPSGKAVLYHVVNDALAPLPEERTLALVGKLRTCGLEISAIQEITVF